MELCMSGQERDRLKVMETVKQGLIGTTEAAKRMRVSLRQAQRLFKGLTDIQYGRAPDPYGWTRLVNVATAGRKAPIISGA